MSATLDRDRIMIADRPDQARHEWGPFRSSVDWTERKAQLRSLRTALRLLCGERGRAAGFAILRAEINADDELLTAAAEEFNRLAPRDRRNVLASFSQVNFEKLPA